MSKDVLFCFAKSNKKDITFVTLLLPTEQMRVSLNRIIKTGKNIKNSE